MAHAIRFEGHVEGDTITGVGPDAAAPSGAPLSMPHDRGPDTRPHAVHPWPDLDVVDGGRMPLRFGEFLVAEGIIDRVQLFRALQIQDRLPWLPIGQCVVALGYLTMNEVEWLFQRFSTTLVAIDP
jgi:hypothetical protein